MALQRCVAVPRTSMHASLLALCCARQALLAVGGDRLCEATQLAGQIRVQVEYVVYIA